MHTLYDQSEPLLRDLAQLTPLLLKTASPTTRVISNISNNTKGLGAQMTQNVLEGGEFGKRIIQGGEDLANSVPVMMRPGQTYVGARLERSDGMLGSMYRAGHRVFGNSPTGWNSPAAMRDADHMYAQNARVGDSLRQEFGTDIADDIISDPRRAINDLADKPSGGAAPGAAQGAPNPGADKRWRPGWGTAAAAAAAVPAAGVGAYQYGQYRANQRNQHDRWLAAGAGFAGGVAAPNLLNNAQSYLQRMGGNAPAARPGPYGGFGV